jgi:hypothetical protein
MAGNFREKRTSITTMGAKTQAFDIFPTPLISHYPLPTMCKGRAVCMIPAERWSVLSSEKMICLVPLLFVLWSETDAMGGKYTPKYVLKNTV